MIAVVEILGPLHLLPTDFGVSYETGKRTKDHPGQNPPDECPWDIGPPPTGRGTHTGYIVVVSLARHKFRLMRYTVNHRKSAEISRWT